MAEVVLKTELEGVKLLKRGKVRDVYEVGENLLIVATDRVSAFDVVLPTGITNKGKVLTQISLYWFRQTEQIIKNHIVATRVEDYPVELQPYKDILSDRSMLVKRSKPLPIEAIVRGYLSGSAWKEYKKSGTVCGIRLPEGLVESARLDSPLYTPSTKAEEGHDVNITFEETIKLVGDEIAHKVKETALKVYSRARDMAELKGIIIADTKMEFGLYDNELILIDELLTPDSSRFWSIKDYQPGKGQDSFDKQIVRDYLLTLDWDQTYPGPELPEEIVKKTADRYEEILRILTG